MVVRRRRTVMRCAQQCRILWTRSYVNKSVIIILESGVHARYVDHVFVWPDANLPFTLTMMGIRTSLENLACRTHAQMGRRILSAIVAYASASPASPLPNMAALANRLASRRTLARYVIDAYPGVSNYNRLFELRALDDELTQYTRVGRRTVVPEPRRPACRALGRTTRGARR